ncbi:MAG: pacearchaeosortase [archaeon]
MKRKITLIFFRYLLIVLAGLSNFYIFYLIFTPLTLHPVSLVFSLFYEVEVVGNIILLNYLHQSLSIELIEACIAGAAYYLLFALNMATPMPLKKRIYTLLFSFFAFFIVNLLRIFLLASILLTYGQYIFDFTHILFWYIFSTLLVALIWIVSVRAYEIKSIPAYTDIRFIWDLGKQAREHRKKAKTKKSNKRKKS